MTFRELLEQIHKDLTEGNPIYLQHKNGGELHITLFSAAENRMFFDWFAGDSDVIALFQGSYIDEKTGGPGWIDTVINFIVCNPESTNWHITNNPRYELPKNERSDNEGAYA